jgi:4a-hydroxytetrahydrobiopterin dehydratase
MGLSYERIGDEAAQAAAPHGWKVEGGVLRRQFDFDTYSGAALFCAAVAHAADRLDHHPEIRLSYGRVVVETWTHSVDGLTAYDLELARQVGALAGG